MAALRGKGWSAAIVASAAVLIAIATICGAFGAHYLRTHLAAAQLRSYETAVRYQFYHSLGLFGLGLAAREFDSRLLHWAARLLICGILLFCGSLYFLSFGAPRIVGVLTPLGGAALIGGWVTFALAYWRTCGR